MCIRCCAKSFMYIIFVYSQHISQKSPSQRFICQINGGKVATDKLAHICFLDYCSRLQPDLHPWPHPFS